jgi:hypothetical protein
MDTFVSIIRDLLSEAYAGRTQSPTWFIDSGEHSGVLGTLETITANDASTASVNGTSSIAAHTHHLCWSLTMANAMMRGEPASRDWAQSWTLHTVTDAAWTQLRANLKHEYERLLEGLPNGFDPTNPIIVSSGVALVAHAAYHLGAIRQMALHLKTTRA